MAIKNILFDLGNVLFDLELSKIESGFRAIWGAEFDLAKSRLESQGVFELYEVGGISTEEFTEAVGKAAEPHIPTAQVEEIWNSIFVEFPAGRFELLQRLRETHQVLLLSNINELHADWIDNYMLTEYQFDNYLAQFFDAAYYSHHIRLRKPDADAFEYVLADAGIKPEETLFIDDLIKNIEGARAVGINAILKEKHKPLEKLLEELI